MFKLVRRNNIMGRVRKMEMIVNRIVKCIRFFNSLVMREIKSLITGIKVLYSHFLVLIDLRWRFNNLFEEMFKKRINMTYNEILLLNWGNEKSFILNIICLKMESGNTPLQWHMFNVIV